jgi:ABC-type spermidine/putrescine transport system permease subunit I
MLDEDLLHASRDLGAGRFHTFWFVTLPLVMPGIFAGIVFTFVPMLGADVVPALLGGGHVHLLGNSVHSLLTALNYPVAAAISTFVLGALVVLLLVFRLLMPRLGGFGEIFEGLRQ